MKKCIYAVDAEYIIGAEMVDRRPEFWVFMELSGILRKFFRQIIDMQI